ncbi:hypothetical protein PI125_g14504 [Phytophthora idaei]|nr:hypothetical protein PI125_g14504 [Phytophthora idaei]KAG3148274.1 hypothetical protein PI126_g12502 [Phytophthora idaei]
MLGIRSPGFVNESRESPMPEEIRELESLWTPLCHGANGAKRDGDQMFDQTGNKLSAQDTSM